MGLESQMNTFTALESPRRPFLTMEEYADETAKKENINSQQFLRLIKCESNWKEDAMGDSGTSFGLLQFKKDTFSLFSKKFDLPNIDIKDPYQQIDLAVRMIKEGQILHWKNCARKTGWTE